MTVTTRASDNTAVVTCLNCLKFVRSNPINSVVLSILHLLMKKSLLITTVYVAATKNVTVDGFARTKPPRSEFI